MRKLTRVQFEKADDWMRNNARSLDFAKWKFLFHGGSKEDMISEILKYQNPDRGLGNGFEADVLCPLSAAIPTAEAIFQAYEYGLDCNAPWFQSILAYFESSVQNIPKYWEDCPKEAMDYPHAPWWSYAPCTVFNPNPCAVVASAFIRYGSESQRRLGYKIAADCLYLLIGDGFCGDHDTLNLLALVEQLVKIDSPLVTDEVMKSCYRRIDSNTCYDRSKWSSYNFAPLDFVSSPDSLWLEAVSSDGIEENFEFWLDTLNEDGVWNPNFSWGIAGDVSRQVTENWKGYVTVKRAKILLAFGRVEL